MAYSGGGWWGLTPHDLTDEQAYTAICNGGAENAGVEKAGVDSRGGKCRSDNLWKAVRIPVVYAQTVCERCS